MTNINSTGRLGYIYDQATDTWYPLAGSVDTTQAFLWSGEHSFSSAATFTSSATFRQGANNFSSPAQRDLLIPNPADGATAFVRNDAAGNSINEVQYYANGRWRPYGDNASLSERASSFILSLADAGRTVDINVSSANTVTIPNNSAVPFLVGTQIGFIQSNTGQTSFAPAAGVTILSKNNNRKIAARYSQAVLIKKSENSWYLIGDLTA